MIKALLSFAYINRDWLCRLPTDWSRNEDHRLLQPFAVFSVGNPLLKVGGVKKAHQKKNFAVRSVRKGTQVSP